MTDMPCSRVAYVLAIGLAVIATLLLIAAINWWPFYREELVKYNVSRRDEP